MEDMARRLLQRIPSSRLQAVYGAGRGVVGEGAAGATVARPCCCSQHLKKRHESLGAEVADDWVRRTRAPRVARKRQEAPHPRAHGPPRKRLDCTLTARQAWGSRGRSVHLLETRSDHSVREPPQQGRDCGPRKRRKATGVSQPVPPVVHPGFRSRVCVFSVLFPPQTS